MNDLNSDYSMYGISSDPFGRVSETFTKDKIERAMANENMNGILKKFIKSSSQATNEMKSLEDDLTTPLRQKEPQAVGGRLFKVKRGKSYSGKFI